MDDKEQVIEGQEGQEGAGEGEGQATPPIPSFDETLFVKKEDFARLEGRLSAFMDNFGMQQHAQQPAQPTGPTIADRMVELDKKMEELDVAFEAAINDGRGVAAIQRKREEIIQAKADLRYGTQIEELKSFGVSAIDQLSGEVVKGSMPHLTINEVKTAYERAISSMPPDQRMNPEARRLAYKFAIGENMDRILELEREKLLRETKVKTGTPGDNEPPATPPTGYPEGVPAPEEILSKENLDALNAKGQGVDDYYRGMGYADWSDYWLKVGKAYHYGEEE